MKKIFYKNKIRRKIKMNIDEENEIEISAEMAEELSNQKGDED